MENLHMEIKKKRIRGILVLYPLQSRHTCYVGKITIILKDALYEPWHVTSHQVGTGLSYIQKTFRLVN